MEAELRELTCQPTTKVAVTFCGPCRAEVEAELRDLGATVVTTPAEVGWG